MTNVVLYALIAGAMACAVVTGLLFHTNHPDLGMLAALMTSGCVVGVYAVTRSVDERDLPLMNVVRMEEI